jgi:ribokinase
LIVVDRNHQNRIVVSPGANDTLRPTDVKRALGRFDEPPAALLLQLESPMDTVTAAAAEARRQGAAVILDPAPVQPSIPDELLRSADFLTPNESEALALLGERGHDISLHDAARLAERLRVQTGADTVILKMGAKGAWIQRADFSRHVRAPKVDAVDTTAAGDTFNGAFAAMLTETGALDAKGRRKNELIADAVEFANCAAAISVTRKGALGSIPTRSEVVALRQRTFEPGTR